MSTPSNAPLKIVYYGNPLLRMRCEEITSITPEIRALAEQMLETMIIENGIGLAAPQIGHALRLFVTQVPIEKEDEEEWIPGTKRVFINPQIINVSNECSLRSEGCLSLPNLYGDVMRPNTAVVEALDLEGNKFSIEVSGLEARCILHENDHINGKLFIDRLEKNERKALENALRKLKQKYN